MDRLAVEMLIRNQAGVQAMELELTLELGLVVPVQEQIQAQTQVQVQNKRDATRWCVCLFCTTTQQFTAPPCFQQQLDGVEYAVLEIVSATIVHVRVTNEPVCATAESKGNWYKCVGVWLVYGFVDPRGNSRRGVIATLCPRGFSSKTAHCGPRNNGATRASMCWNTLPTLDPRGASLYEGQAEKDARGPAQVYFAPAGVVFRTNATHDNALKWQVYYRPSVKLSGWHLIAVVCGSVAGGLSCMIFYDWLLLHRAFIVANIQVIGRVGFARRLGSRMTALCPSMRLVWLLRQKMDCETQCAVGFLLDKDATAWFFHLNGNIEHPQTRQILLASVSRFATFGRACKKTTGAC